MSNLPGTCHRCRVGSEADCRCPEPDAKTRLKLERAIREFGCECSRCSKEAA